MKKLSNILEHLLYVGTVLSNGYGEEETLPFKVLSSSLIIKSTWDGLTSKITKFNFTHKYIWEPTHIHQRVHIHERFRDGKLKWGVYDIPSKGWSKVPWGFRRKEAQCRRIRKADVQKLEVCLAI